MSKYKEDYQNALKTMKGINEAVKALNWKSKNINTALDGVWALLGVVDDQANENVPETDWTLNAMVDGVFENPNHKSNRELIIGNLNKIEQYLETQV